MVWRNSDSLEDVVHTFKREATIWNKEHFGNIFAKKKKIMARLNGIQRVITSNPSSSLLYLERKLQLELENVLNQESEL